MKTFNQVVEEEVTKYVEDYAQAITDVGGFGLAKHIKDHLTQAMNKAALAILEEMIVKVAIARGNIRDSNAFQKSYPLLEQLHNKLEELLPKQLTDKE